MEVSVGQSFADFLRGEMSIRVMDEKGARIYKVKTNDLKAIYESIEREVKEKIERQIRELPKKLITTAEAIGDIADTANEAREMLARYTDAVPEEMGAE